MIVLLDNRDSFVHNVARYLRQLGAETVVLRSDETSIEQIQELGPTRLVVSPGPGKPEGAGVSVEAIRRLGPQIPTLGICLGHQCIGAAFGATITGADRPLHGVASAVRHLDRGLFRGLPNPLEAGRYHSLVVDPQLLPDTLVPDAWSESDEIMALSHRTLPIWGIQFHPESVLTPRGSAVLSRFLQLASDWDARLREGQGAVAGARSA